MKRVIYYFKVLFGLHKSLFLSIRYFGLKGLCLPILVTYRTQLTVVRGKVLFNSPLRLGLVRMGFTGVALSSFHQWNVWNVQGKIEFFGKAEFGTGTRLFVGSKGYLSIGDRFLLTAESEIICHHRVQIGQDVLISWDVLIMDTDSHPIRKKDGGIINLDRKITIGDNVWIGCRAIILKGATIKNNSIVAINSLAHRNYIRDNVLIGGYPGQVIMSDIEWKREHFK